MIGMLRKNSLSKILLGFMGMYLLNICVAPPQLQLDRVQSQVVINEQESIVEIIVEKVLGFEDAIEDYKDSEQENQSKKTNQKLEIIAHKLANSLTSIGIEPLIQKLFLYKISAVLSDYFPLEDPPPKN